MIQVAPMDSRTTQMGPVGSRMLQTALFESRGHPNALGASRLALETFGIFQRALSGSSALEGGDSLGAAPLRGAFLLRCAHCVWRAQRCSRILQKAAEP